MDVLQTLSHIRTVRRDTFSGAILVFDEWFRDDRRHREHGPASLVRDVAAGVILREAWWRDGKLHRVAGPAITQRAAASGLIVRESWWRLGQRHRTDGPAVIVRDAGADVTVRAEWWRRGLQGSPPAEPGRRSAAVRRPPSASPAP